MRTQLIGYLLTLSLVTWLHTTRAQATIIPLTASLDCAQANAGDGTCGLGGSGTGTAVITFDTATNLLSWNVSWSGLSGSESAMHFHGPAPPNQNAGVQVGVGVGANPAIGSATISAAQAADLQADLWYLNLHTADFGQGEIRGQVVPEPTTFLLAALGLLGLLGLGRRRRK